MGSHATLLLSNGGSFSQGTVAVLNFPRNALSCCTCVAQLRKAVRLSAAGGHVQQTPFGLTAPSEVRTSKAPCERAKCCRMWNGLVCTPTSDVAAFIEATQAGRFLEGTERQRMLRSTWI